MSVVVHDQVGPKDSIRLGHFLNQKILNLHYLNNCFYQEFFFVHSYQSVMMMRHFEDGLHLLNSPMMLSWFLKEKKKNERDEDQRKRNQSVIYLLLMS